MDFFLFISVTFLIHYQYEFRKSTCKKSVIFPTGLHACFPSPNEKTRFLLKGSGYNL